MRMGAGIVAPSLLSADFSRMIDGLKLIHESRADWVHLDVMDGSFVPEITFGRKMVSDLRRHSQLPFDVHLMVNHPETFIQGFCEAGADYLTVHIESATHIHRLLGEIREMGKKPGISIVPSTPLESILEIIHMVELVLVMTVNPGYGGQKLIPACLDKVARLKAIREERQMPFLIEVDGGINQDTVVSAKEAGADILVVGSAFFSSTHPEEFVQQLKG